MSIILFGFKGCGKTYLGRLLSMELKLPFIDTDDLIVRLYHKRAQHLSVREIHQTLGEADFRILEKAAIKKINPDSHAVIALGGGVILDPDNVAYLQRIGQLIYIKVSFDTIQQRIINNGIPSFVDAADPIQSLCQIYQQRLPIYESIPAKSIHADFLDQEGCMAALRSIIVDSIEKCTFGLRQSSRD